MGKGVINGHLWNDLNANGIREDGEPAITSTGISFWSVDEEDQFGYTTTHDGPFYCRLAPARREAENRFRNRERDVLVAITAVAAGGIRQPVR